MAKYAKTWDVLTEKRESGIACEKCDFPPESGNVDTYSTYVSSNIALYTLHSEL